MPPWAVAISAIFALIMVVLLLREVRDNRSRIGDRAAERARRAETSRRVTDHWRGEG